MRHDGSGLGFSATDLAHFSACAQRTLLDRLRTLGKASPERLIPDPRLDLLRERGYAHEGAYLEQRRAEGKRVVTFADVPPEERNPAGYARRAAETEAAMRGGADVIHQGMLVGGVWLGAVDFLVRVDTPSAFGAWSYEVIDAKLAREARAAAVLQTCVYSELLARVQGAAPEHVHLYLGGPAPRLATYRLAHFGRVRPRAQTLKRLVGRYGTGTEALDRLLQQRVFVDLHRVVKQAVRASAASYSIKALLPSRQGPGYVELTTRGRPTSDALTSCPSACWRFWAPIPDFGGRYLRVVTLEDRTTIHKAFPDRGFKP